MPAPTDELTPDLLVYAYCHGVFPMGYDDGTVAWFSPDPRGVIELDEFHVGRNLRKLVRRGVFEIRVNAAFGEVLRACGQRELGTWISDEIISAYMKLHDMGFAHSVEAWQDGALAGGLYGVAIGGAFFGESMFYRVTDSSKVALAALVERLRARGYRLLDTQWTTPHLERFGARYIPRRVYLARLASALALPCVFDDSRPVAPPAHTRVPPE